MATFYESDSSPIASELVRQGFTLDRGEVLRIVDLDERASGTDTAIALGTAAISLVAACGTLALSGFTLPILAPIAALSYAGLTAWNSRATKQEREFEAEFLHRHPEFVEAVNQKLSAGEDGDRVAAAYEHTLKAFISGDAQRMQSFLPAAPSHQMAPSPVDEATAPIATSSPIGEQTRLGAVAVPSSPAGETSALFNPAIDLGQNPQSALIVGTPGSGKGMLVSNAVRVLREKAPALKVMMIDPKGDPKEKGYWAPVTDVYRSMNLMDCDDPDQGAQWLLNCMDEFRKLPAPKLLIFDEMLAASTEISLAHKDFKAPQRLKKFVSGIIAQGDSQGVWVWAMSQSVQVADLGFGGGVRGNLRAIAIISPKNTTAIEALTSTQLIPKPVGGMDELRAIMKASPANRAFYDGKLSRWLPMPKLENHSGFDRDNRTIEANPTVSKSDAPKTQEKSAETPNQTKPASPVDQLNKMFQSEAFTPAHEDGNADDETAIEQSGTVMSIAEDLIKYIKSKPDVEVWSISTVRKANKKYRRYDDASLVKAFHILSLSDEGRWDGEKFRPN